MRVKQYFQGGIRHPAAPAQNPASRGGATGTPTLIIPTDPGKWREMQRNLVVGGVYHVQQQANGQQGAQYCLWNGSQLVPCEYYILRSVTIVIFWSQLCI